MFLCISCGKQTIHCKFGYCVGIYKLRMTENDVQYFMKNLNFVRFTVNPLLNQRQNCSCLYVSIITILLYQISPSMFTCHSVRNGRTYSTWTWIVLDCTTLFESNSTAMLGIANPNKGKTIRIYTSLHANSDIDYLPEL